MTSSGSLKRINALARLINSGAEDIATTSGELAGMAEKQKSMVNRFKLGS